MVATYLRARELDNESVVHELILFDVSCTRNAVLVLPEACYVFLRDQVTLDENMTNVKNNYKSVDIRAAIGMEDETRKQCWFNCLLECKDRMNHGIFTKALSA